MGLVVLKKRIWLHSSFLMVVEVTADVNYQQKLNTEIADMTKRGEPMPAVVYVNGKLRPPASKAKS